MRGDWVCEVAEEHVGRYGNRSSALSANERCAGPFLLWLRFPPFLLCRAYSLVDSSQVSTFLISILLIVYGSFR